MSINIYIVLFYRSSKPAIQQWLAIKRGGWLRITYLLPDIFDFLSFIHTSAGQGHLENKPSILTKGSMGWGFVAVKLV